MSELFRNVLNATFQGSIVITAVLFVRLILKKAPKKYTCLLWILVGLRLLVPFSFESELSLQPEEQIVTQAQWEKLQSIGKIVVYEGATEKIYDAPDVLEEPVHISEFEGPVDADETKAYEIRWAELAPYLWMTGVAGLAVYSLVSYLLLKRQVREAVHLFGNVWECAGLDTAFILGFVKPKIYIPTNMDEGNRRFILEHERTHLERFDNWVKLIGFAALTVHWFNPLVWLSYILLCRDIEMACDEYVIRDMGLEERKRYSAALLACSTNRAHWAACPVAFGEVSVKQRILSVLNYRKKSFWFSIIGVVAIIFVAVCFLTNQAKDTSDQWEAEIRAVLEEIQRKDSCHIMEQRQFEGENILNDSADINFFKSGKNWLKLSYIDDLVANGWDGCLYMDGNYYESVADEPVFDWKQTGESRTSGYDPWLYTFDIGAQEAEVISWKSAGEGYEIRLKIHAPYHDLGESYHVDFCFDHEGNFRNAVLYVQGMEEGVAGEWREHSMTSTMYVMETPEADIRSSIEVYAQTLESGMPIAQTDTAEPDWGIQVGLDDVSPTGLTYVITQSGDLVLQELCYGQYYSLERWTGSRWEAVEPIIDNGAFTTEAIYLKKNATTGIGIEWEWLYGALPEGTYRIGKTISNEVEYRIGVDSSITAQNPEEISYTYYACFEITDDPA